MVYACRQLDQRAVTDIYVDACPSESAFPTCKTSSKSGGYLKMNSDGIAYIPPILTSDSEIELPSSTAHSTEQRKEVQHSEILKSDLSDESLLTEVGNGSKDALAILFRRHQRAVFNVAWRILRDQSEAEDLRQEVFLLLFQKAKLFDANKGMAVSWIIQITYHRGNES